MNVSRPMLAWLVVIVVVYLGFTVLCRLESGPRVDVPTLMAERLLQGEVSLDEPPGRLDTVTRGGRSYHVVGLGPILPYLVFVPFEGLRSVAPWVVSVAFGILAAGLAWPLAARYGPGGTATPWLATLAAAGTLLLPLATQGNFYYLAHVEATAFLFVALIEWAGRRRGWVIGSGLALAALARPTVLLAAVPFALYLVLDGGRRARALAGFAAPIVAIVGVMGLYNLARFGSPLEAGYGLAILQRNVLLEARRAGVFSLRHVGDNLAVLLAQGFDLRPSFPFLVPPRSGHSILLTSPALLTAIYAGFRDRTAQMLWMASALTLIPLLLYYGGAGYVTYGYRYFMDVVPFLLALVAMGARRRFGRPEQLLIGLSVAFCVYGAAWGAAGGHL